ncbi:MAG: hypothetical protein HC853_17200 [Anaerolineae bacterium]|nr:hypothetical protein [Anaerolineae bacterium]
MEHQLVAAEQDPNRVGHQHHLHRHRCARHRLLVCGRGVHRNSGQSRLQGQVTSPLTPDDKNRDFHADKLDLTVTFSNDYKIASLTNSTFKVEYRDASGAWQQVNGDFEQVYGKNISLKLFIRQIVGLDRNAAKAVFANYLEGGNFTANQIRFVENVIDYLTQNGVMNPGLLYESPFTDIHTSGLDGVFNDHEADEIISLVRSFNEAVDNPFKGVA